MKYSSLRRRLGSDGLFSLCAWFSAGAVTAIFFWILSDLIINGIGNLSWAFITEASVSAGREGGIGPVIISTLLIVGICMVVTLPVGVGASVYLAEFTRSENLFGRLIRSSLDILAGVPSIVFGLFGNAVFCFYLGFGFSILSGGLTLSCMVLPLVIRATEEGLRSVPQEYRLAAAALGMSPTRILSHILLPLALPGLIAGFVLGSGRAIAETAALIFTSGYVDRMPYSLMDSGRSLSVHIYDLSMNVTGGESNAYSTALVLIGVLLVINGATSLLMKHSLQRKC